MTILEKLLANAKANPKTGCLEWQRGRRKGYGVLRFEGQNHLAHRAAWAVANGPIPTGLCVLHKCDNPKCINPDHLFLGTIADNCHDRHAKGRDAKGDNHGSHTRPDRVARGTRHGSKTMPERILRGDDHPARKKPQSRARGEQNGLAKLTRELVIEIRNRFAAGGISCGKIAKEMGLSRGTIEHVVRRATWKHV
jgi:hypothetical protein